MVQLEEGSRDRHVRQPEPAQLEALSWAFATSPNPTFVADLGARVLFVNDAGRTWWARSGGEDVVSLFPDEAQERVRLAHAALLTSGESSRFEWSLRSPGGVRAWFTCTLSPLKSGEEVVGILGVSSDVTELKRSEERLRLKEKLLVDAQGVAHLGTWEWDVSEPNATWSDELYRIYGLTPELYKPSYEQYLTMVHPDDRQRVIDATNRVFHEHVPYSHDERIFRPDGSIRYLHTWAYPVLDEGKLTKLVGVCQDITDRAQAEEAVRQMNHELERRVTERTRTIETSMRDLEAFNSMVSHDLKAPLTTIELNCSSLMRRETLAPTVIERLERIQRAVRQMVELINDLLTLARVGQGAIVREEIDLSEMSTEIVANQRRIQPRGAIEILIEPDLRVTADRGLLRAAMENLIGNAWKYSSKAAPARIEIGAEKRDGRRTFYVRDNGAGFDMKDAHRLFAPFERLHESSEFEGTGIGLATVQRIIERHGGRVWAEGVVDQGATFWFELG